MRVLLLLPHIHFKMARSPSGKAEDCKSSIVGSIPTRASTFFIEAVLRSEKECPAVARCAGEGGQGPPLESSIVRLLLTHSLRS